MWPRLLGTRADNVCPDQDGAEIGTDQSFTVSCGTAISGDVLDTPAVNSFVQCVDLCASHHPRCDGVTFSDQACLLKANLEQGGGRPSRFIDSATGIVPPSASNCTSLAGSIATVAGRTAQLFCGAIVNGNDLRQAFAPSLQDCIGLCAATGGCAGVSFDASTDMGFKNCYLKGPFDGSAVADIAGIDTALLAAAGAAPDAAPAQSPPPPAEMETVVPAPPPAMSFFTPPAPSQAPPPAVVASAMVSVTLVTGEQTTVSVTRLRTVYLTPSSAERRPPRPSTASMAASAATPVAEGGGSGVAQVQDGADDNGGAASGPGARVGAAVGGTIAALLLLGALGFFFFRRRRRAAEAAATAAETTTRGGWDGTAGDAGHRGWLGSIPWRAQQAPHAEGERGEKAASVASRSSRAYPEETVATPRFEVRNGQMTTLTVGGRNGLRMNRPVLDEIPDIGQMPDIGQQNR